MKILMIHTERFAFRTRVKALDTAPDLDERDEIENALVGFIQIEKKDEDDESGTETKLVKNLKWAARKNDTERIVLHSFAHLGESKAAPDITKRIFDNAEERLRKTGYEASQTPYGYFLDLHIDAPGRSLARIFKEF